MKDTTLISIIIPTYNRAHLLGETLDSVLDQTYEHWECIVVDDGSTDATKELMAEYIIKDTRFQYHQRPINRLPGGNGARNYGFEMSKGEYINWFDSDDIMQPGFLEEKLQLLLEDETLDFCACFSETFNINKKNILNLERPLVLKSDNLIEDYMLNGLYFFTPSPLWKKSFLIKENLSFDETLKRSQERDFHFRVLFRKPKFIYLEKPLYLIRVGLENGISNNFSKNFELQLSNFMYFNKAFNLICKSGTESNKEKLLRYIFYRQSVHFYTMFTMTNVAFKKRIHFYFKYFPILIQYLKDSKLGLKYFIKICFGGSLILLFNKGYNFFHFPQFNYRKND